MSPAPPDPLAFLPHGPEFRFIDRILSLVPGKNGAAEYRVRGDEIFLRGHFPGAPLFPGVLLLEAAAQLTGVVAQSDPAQEPMADLKLTAVRQIKITRSARPGETLRIESRISGRFTNLVQADVEIRVNGQSALAGELTLSGVLR